MPTHSRDIRTLHNWIIWNGADFGARVDDAEGRRTQCAR